MESSVFLEEEKEGKNWEGETWNSFLGNYGKYTWGWKKIEEESGGRNVCIGVLHVLSVRVKKKKLILQKRFHVVARFYWNNAEFQSDGCCTLRVSNLGWNVSLETVCFNWKKLWIENTRIIMSGIRASNLKYTCVYFVLVHNTEVYIYVKGNKKKSRFHKKISSKLLSKWLIY